MTAQGAADPFEWMGKGMGMAGGPTEEEIVDAQKAQDDAAEAQMAQAQLIAGVLTQGNGPMVLELLQAVTLDLPLMDVTRSLVEGQVNLSPAEWAYVREGQNSVVRWLISNIRLAQNPPPAFQTGGNTHDEG